MTDVTPLGTPSPGTPIEELPTPPATEPPARLSVDTEMSMHYDFKTENGIWISANPLAMESRSSLNTNTTYSTITDDRFDRMSTVSHALTLDTSVASSAASMMSSIDSASSADVYGWEEELDRKESIETTSAWEREAVLWALDLALARRGNERACYTEC
ncbi:hypothetical protein M7I_5038 [Glarea lozoyensis 74030]|uniref:Uncharacterized protein n=1 Tax=Glarea lozoyensis (strain ATCC 74030 / MF5533) TaxID=1104152 RepID=H0EQT1_GLAL7|nr:hypothetical protein M7I_5038 [Glarea lozoyensis 74030]